MWPRSAEIICDNIWRIQNSLLNMWPTQTFATTMQGLLMDKLAFDKATTTVPFRSVETELTSC